MESDTALESIAEYLGQIAAELSKLRWLVEFEFDERQGIPPGSLQASAGPWWRE